MTDTDREFAQLKQTIKEALLEGLQENRGYFLDLLVEVFNEVPSRKAKLAAPATKRTSPKSGRKVLKKKL